MKKHFFTGLVVLLPIALTFLLILFLFDLFTEPLIRFVGPFVELLKEKFSINLPSGVTLFISRVLSLIFLTSFIFLLGIFTQLFLVRHLINWGNAIFLKMPIVKTVYKLSKDIFSALFSTDEKKAFKRPVMIPFPSKPNEALGFEAGEIAKEIEEKAKQKLTPVFLPTAPHPISGFLFFVPEKSVSKVDLSNEQVVKFLVSCGMSIPEEPNNPGQNP